MINRLAKTPNAKFVCLGLQNFPVNPMHRRRALVIAGGLGYCAMVTLTCLLATLAIGDSRAMAQSLASDWVPGHNVRTRLVAGQLPAANSGSNPTGASLAAGLEIELSPGWKTYWRIPGDAGGVPPEFDWSESENVMSVDVRYPAPKRLTDSAGSTIGYKEHVMFPVLINAKDATRPVKLRLIFAFGVCRDICVPSEGTYELTIPPNGAPQSPEIVTALALVPKPQATAKDEAKPTPRLTKVEADLAAKEPKVAMHVLFPGGVEGGDVFVEGPVGEYVPMTVPTGKDADGAQVFVIELAKGADIAALKGKPLRVTMVSKAGHAETSFTLK